jgi:hypothetical protein
MASGPTLVAKLLLMAIEISIWGSWEQRLQLEAVGAASPIGERGSSDSDWKRQFQLQIVRATAPTGGGGSQ